MTTLDEIAKSVVELIKYKGKWPKYFYFVGENTTWNKVLKTAEEVTGEKFQVTYKTVQELQEIAKHSNDPMKKFYAQVDLCYTDGSLLLHSNTETQQILKNVNFTSVKDFLQNNYRK